MFRRALGSLLVRRFSPQATPTMASAARSLRSSFRELAIGGAAGLATSVVTAALATGGLLAVQYFQRGAADDESAARKKEEDMKARFAEWMKKYDKSYKDDEEKAMRFQRFKATVGAFSRPPVAINYYFADWTDQEIRKLHVVLDRLAREEECQNFVIKSV